MHFVSPAVHSLSWPGASFLASRSAINIESGLPVISAYILNGGPNISL